MPIPLFTASEKPSNAETLRSHQGETITSTPLTSGSPHEPTPERRRSLEHQAPAAVSGSGTVGSASAGGREQTKEERETEKLYEERMEDEYAKREGGA